MYNPFAVEGKRFLLTGAASGIGRETAIMLSKMGARLVLADINLKGLKETAASCCSEAIVLELDLTDSAGLKPKIAEVVKSGGKLDGVAHIAGIPCIAPLKVVTEEMALKVLKLNTLPALELAKIFSAANINNGGGSVVLISSVYGVVGSAANVVYAMSKSAIVGITRSLSIELAPRKIRVNCVAPGFVETPMKDKIQGCFDENHDDLVAKLHPLGLGQPQDIAKSIIFLLSDGAQWMTGSILNVDGGFTAQ